MTVLMVPPFDDEPWPTLGPEVCAWIEAHLCHGPGDLLGEPVKLNDEQRGWIYRVYEVGPEKLRTRKGKVISSRANPDAGKRRFHRCAFSLRKGSSKTEFAAWIAGVELHPDGPVRCAGFTTSRGVRVPIGRGVTDPYIPMISYTEEQTEELAYGALRRILEKSSIGSDFDIGLERIMRVSGDGKAEAVSASPNARDGARTTFQHADETHRFELDTLKRAWKVMLANLSKRPIADPWALETTTAPEPGMGSVAESTMDYAKEIAARDDAQKSRLFFFHREASPSHDMETEGGLRAAIVEASGPYIAKWSAIGNIAEQFRQPDADTAYLERVWLNRPVQASGVAFDIAQWKGLERSEFVADGTAISLGFDGSRFDDATALIGTVMETGFQFPLGIWLPKHLPNGSVEGVNEEEVDGAVSDIFERFEVVRMYCDPEKWESWVGLWANRYGKERVLRYLTRDRKPMAYAIRAYRTAMASGEVGNDGDATVLSHMANARRHYTNLVDEQGAKLWILRKERPDSPNKIDAAVAGVLSWTARTDAMKNEDYQMGGSVYGKRGVILL